MAENHDTRSRRQAVILSQEPLDENAFRAVIDATCYTTGGYPNEDMRKEGAVPILEEVIGDL